MCGPRHLVINATRQAVSKILFVGENRAADFAETDLSTEAWRYIVVGCEQRAIVRDQRCVRTREVHPFHF